MTRTTNTTAGLKIEIVRGRRTYRRIFIRAGKTTALQGATVKRQISTTVGEKTKTVDEFRFVPHGGVGKTLRADTHADLLAKIKARFTRLGRFTSVELAEMDRVGLAEKLAAERAASASDEEGVNPLDDFQREALSELANATDVVLDSDEPASSDVELA